MTTPLLRVHLERVGRLRKGNWQFGCDGKHRGTGSHDCPRELHHHHDILCLHPTLGELREAEIDPKEFRVRSRA